MAKTLSAGVIPARRTPHGWRLLVLRAFRNWDFPKGVVDPGEDPKAAAVRETAEETGLTGLDFAFGDGYRETMPYAGGKVARYYLAVTDEERDHPARLRGARPGRARRMALGGFHRGRRAPAAAAAADTGVGAPDSGDSDDATR